jgi:hypothetical protein
MSDFALNKKRKFPGWKRTSYRNQVQTAFYKDEVNYMDDEVYKKSEEY